jgi:Nucleoside 2-deoxyribosyltransferase like
MFKFILFYLKMNCYSSRTSQNGNHPFQITSLSPKSSLRIKKQIFADEQMLASSLKIPGNSKESTVEAPEVFLGGSCNPTTWRADVAMPELEKLGISYYNPVCYSFLAWLM